MAITEIELERVHHSLIDAFIRRSRWVGISTLPSTNRSRLTMVFSGLNVRDYDLLVQRDTRGVSPSMKESHLKQKIFFGFSIYVKIEQCDSQSVGNT
jgi:hypothetical protein